MPCSYDAYKINKYFADTVYLVEADSYSQLALWAENDKRESKYKLSWEQLNPGSWFVVGYLDEEKTKPVTVDCAFNRINGRVVCFYTSVSRFCDWNMVEDWFEKNCKPLNKRGSIAKCNAINIAHCYNFIRELGWFMGIGIGIGRNSHSCYDKPSGTAQA